MSNVAKRLATRRNRNVISGVEGGVKPPSALAAMMLAIPIAVAAQAPAPLGVLIDIGGGQHVHVHCTGAGSPTVVLENGAGDFSVIWSLVQPDVSTFTRVCSYDRGGFAWSDPGARPRSYAQIALELRTALARAHVDPPYVLVGQSYGGLLVRGFAAQYRTDVVGMVLVDAVHEDQRVVYGGQPHRLRDQAGGRVAPRPHIALDTALLTAMRDSVSPASTQSLPAPLDRLPPDAQAIWRWAEAQSVYRASRSAELEWSPEEMARLHHATASERSLGDLPLIVLARTNGGYADGMDIPADSLERERRALMADLAHLSRRGILIYAAHAGHSIHLEDPGLVVQSIREVVDHARH
jgi:pimeloyl-ACP methyl ester carboxylesterase